MITDHSSAIPGSADPGSTSGEAHNLTAPPTLTTALILDPTGPGYRLDSKSGPALPGPARLGPAPCKWSARRGTVYPGLRTAGPGPGARGLRVQAVARSRRVQDKRSGKRRVNGGGMTPVVTGPRIGRSRDRVMMIGDHPYELLSADSSKSL